MDNNTDPSPITPMQQAQPERQRGMEMVIPINRSAWAIVAGYIALFNIPLVLPAPLALICGIVALIDLRKNPNLAGRGRAWFAVIYSLLTIGLIVMARIFL